MKIGYIGLGKMGLAMTIRMKEKGYDVVAWNRSGEPRIEAERQGIKTVETISALIDSLKGEKRKIVWLMVTHNAVDKILDEIIPLLGTSDLVIDGGNSFYKDTMRRAKRLAKKGIHFLDVGTSGGPGGARNGACLMIGGEKKYYEKMESLFKDLSKNDAYKYLGDAGAGHFVKMVHNGIEYGMMQAIGEGFAVIKKSKFRIKLEDAADIYNNGSVIESRLTEWLKDGFKKYSEDLDEVSGSVAHTGEGEWTVKTAEDMGIQVPVIKSSFQFRVRSTKNPSFIGRILSMLRNQFGGHSIK